MLVLALCGGGAGDGGRCSVERLVPTFDTTINPQQQGPLTRGPLHDMCLTRVHAIAKIWGASFRLSTPPSMLQLQKPLTGGLLHDVHLTRAHAIARGWLVESENQPTSSDVAM
jgi:hypothetical protein